MNRLFAFVGALCLALPAYAADQQVDSDTYKASSRTNPFGARSDGLFYHCVDDDSGDPSDCTKVPYLVGNGDGFQPLGPTYRDDFDYGDGLGVTCSSLTGRGVEYVIVTGESDGTCNTACAQQDPPGDCVVAHNSTTTASLAACSSATAEECLCAMPETPDLNCANAVVGGSLTMLEFARGLNLVWAYIPDPSNEATANTPDMDASSLDLAGDHADNEGGELFGGMYGASGRPFVVGDDPAFAFCASVAIADVSGTDSFLIGFREAEAHNETVDDYQELAAIGPESGNIQINTIDNNAATSTTDTTDNYADAAAAVEYCVFVSDTGVVTYTIDDSAPTTTAAFTFEDGLAVVPFISYLQASDLSGEIDLTKWEVFYQ